MNQISLHLNKWIKSISVRHILVVLATMLLLSAVSVTLLGFVVPKDVTISEGAQEIKVTTTRIYVEELLAEQGITLRSGDRISAPLHSVLRNDDKITIERGKTIYLTVDGSTKEIYSCAATLAEALKENNIVRNEYDEIEPYLETPVTEGMTAQIRRIVIKEETREEVIPKTVIVKPNTDQYSGYSKVISEGQDGLATVTYRVITRDGQEASRDVVSQVVHKEAVNEVIEKGTLGSKTVVASTSELKVKQVIQCTATAYSSGPAHNGIYAGQTATGRKPAYGVIAVDPRVIPLGTKMYVEAVDGSWTYGYAVAGDTGGAIKGNKVDLFFDTDYECRQFGRRQAKIYILE